jgi:tRNA U34 5-carboxymethylaminomethyl modifying enzyme MnmG/GidA
VLPTSSGVEKSNFPDSGQGLLGQECSLSTSTRGESFNFLTQTNKAGTGIVWPPASAGTNRKHLGLRIEANGEIRNHFQARSATR